MTEFSNIQDLVKLFNPPKDDDDSDEEIVNRDLRDELPVDVNKPKPYAKISPTHEKDGEELVEEDFLNIEPQQSTDWKKTPTFTITYGQTVTPSDVYLQMSAKTPATSSCEDMKVTINLPGERMQNIDLKVLKDKLTVVSPSFYLDTPLSHPVDPKKGNAKWDSDREALIVTLQMDREFDFINF